MIFVRIPSVLVLTDKETVVDMKYYSKQYISIIGFSYAEKVLSSSFHWKLVWLQLFLFDAMKSFFEVMILEG